MYIRITAVSNKQNLKSPKSCTSPFVSSLDILLFIKFQIKGSYICYNKK